MRALTSGFLCIFAFCARGVLAEGRMAQSPWLPDAVFFQGAAGEHTHAYCGGAQWRLRESLSLGRDMYVSAHLEVVLGRWRAQTAFDSDAHHWTNQISVIPTIRLKSNIAPSWYVDTGVGPSYLSPRFHNKDKSFSSRFQFRSHVGLGIRTNAGSERAVHHDVEFRVEHFSNAGYVKPNPGVNLFAIRYTYLF
jgi:lipid A 3-O-deacylase